MSSTLFIDGLLASVGEQELTGMCSQFGNVLSVDICQPLTALSSGIGIVEMASQEDAAKAISALHRSHMNGSLLLVFHAQHARKTSGDLPGIVANQVDEDLRFKKPKARLTPRAIPHKSGTGRTVISFTPRSTSRRGLGPETTFSPGDNVLSLTSLKLQTGTHNPCDS